MGSAFFLRGREYWEETENSEKESRDLIAVYKQLGEKWP